MNVLIALDESRPSAHAARVAAGLFSPCGAAFTVVNVARTPTPWVGGAGYGIVAPLPPDPSWFEHDHADEVDLMERAEVLGLPDPAVLLEVGDPVSVICEAAQRHDIDVIVVGSHDKSALRRLIDPSVADGVVHGSHVPVLVVSDERR